MIARQLLGIAWPAFLAACLLQVVVFAFVDPLDIHWFGRELAWSRQAVYAAGFFVFWGAAIFSSALTLLLGLTPSRPAPGRED